MPRNSTTYNDAILSFNVSTNPTYQKNGNTTYCNIFAQDVMNHADISTPLPTGGCSTMLTSLKGNNFPHWHDVTFTVAQSRANQGYPGIAITSGHVAVVRPNGGTVPAAAKNVAAAQAGASCFDDKTLAYSWAWSSNPPTDLKFYSWYD